MLTVSNVDDINKIRRILLKRGFSLIRNSSKVDDPLYNIYSKTYMQLIGEIVIEFKNKKSSELTATTSELIVTIRWGSAWDIKKYKTPLRVSEFKNNTNDALNRLTTYSEKLGSTIKLNDYFTLLPVKYLGPNGARYTCCICNCIFFNDLEIVVAAGKVEAYCHINCLSNMCRQIHTVGPERIDNTTREIDLT